MLASFSDVTRDCSEGLLSVICNLAISNSGSDAADTDVDVDADTDVDADDVVFVVVSASLTIVSKADKSGPMKNSE